MQVRRKTTHGSVGVDGIWLGNHFYLILICFFFLMFILFMFTLVSPKLDQP